MKTLRVISRLIVGIIFVFSGFVKSVDPLGSNYKFIDYFNAFDLGFLNSMAMPFAILLSVAEILIGIALLMGYRMRFFSWAVLVFMSFFTVLTFILALTNPVSDCGCFGDAIILTNWQTFFKNVVIMGFVFVVFFSKDLYPQVRSITTEWAILGIYFLAGIFFSLYNYRHLPVLDFRPFSIGTHIPSAMRIPEGATPDVYETKLIYRNLSSGQSEEFSIENFPRDTDEWEFVDSESVIVSKGYEPPIHDFIITDSNKDDITSDITGFPGYTLLLISYDLEKADPDAVALSEKFYNLSLRFNDLNFFGITATSSDKSAVIADSLKLNYHFMLADEIMLKTVVRSNPGLVLLSNGTVMAKWGYPAFTNYKNGNSLPARIEQIEGSSLTATASELFLPLVLTQYRQIMEKGIIYFFILGFFISVFIIRATLNKR